MKRSFLLISAALLTGALTAPLMAQENPVPTRYGENHSYVQHFDGYLDGHPDVARDLHRDPRLIDNPQFVRNHPELHQYLKNHPEMAENFRAHPDRFIHREHRYDRSERRWNWHHDHNANRG
jgi:hypothetical protein